MTNEDAIKEIQRWLDGCPYADTKEAFGLAIKALERPQGEFTLNELKGYLLFYGYSSDAVEDTLINFESYVKGKKGGAENG